MKKIVTLTLCLLLIGGLLISCDTSKADESTNTSSNSAESATESVTEESSEESSDNTDGNSGQGGGTGITIGGDSGNTGVSPQPELGLGEQPDDVYVIESTEG